MILKSSLGVRSIQGLINSLESYKQSLRQKTDAMLQNLAAKGEEIAKSECPVRTGHLFNSITGLCDGNGKAIIRVNCPYAVYVEMGTGIKGANSPHPNTAVLGFTFAYDRNGHGEKGWWYPTDEKDPNPTKITAKNGKIYAWTRGMPSRPFMYNTAQQLKDIIRR